MYTCQCEGLQMGQSSGVLSKEVAALWEVSFNRGVPVIPYSRGYALYNIPHTRGKRPQIKDRIY